MRQLKKRTRQRTTTVPSFNSTSSFFINSVSPCKITRAVVVALSLSERSVYNYENDASELAILTPMPTLDNSSKSSKIEFCCSMKLCSSLTSSVLMVRAEGSEWFAARNEPKLLTLRALVRPNLFTTNLVPISRSGKLQQILFSILHYFGQAIISYTLTAPLQNCEETNQPHHACCQSTIHCRPS